MFRSFGFSSEHVCLPQTVNQDLLAAPLVPPQLSAKDFYMTGEHLLFLAYVSGYLRLSLCINLLSLPPFCAQTPSAELLKRWRNASKPWQKEPPPWKSHQFAEHPLLNSASSLEISERTRCLSNLSCPKCLLFGSFSLPQSERSLLNKGEKCILYE